MDEATTESILTGAPPAGEPIRIDYVPRDGLLRLTIINFLLGIVTLTIYRFWAKTNVRRHIWRCVHINGEPLAERLLRQLYPAAINLLAVVARRVA